MKTILLKISGKSIENFLDDRNSIKKIKELQNSFDALIIVHGAGIKISEWSQVFGLKPKFYMGQRITDKDTMEIVAAVQAGLINTKLISMLQTNQVNAIGLTGVDNGLFTAEYINEDLGYVGVPVFCENKAWLYSIMQEGIIPVFSSICKDEDGNLMNVNADIFAKELAIAVEADTVLFLSDISGVKLNGSVQTVINDADINEGILSGQITDGMIPKLKSCLNLIHNGARKVWIGDDLSGGNYEESFSENNLKGTWIVESKTITA